MIILLRHTSLDIEPETFYGQSDVNVSKDFQKEVFLIKEKMKKLKINDLKPLVFSSPLKRCKKLALEIFSNFKIDDRLKELNFGDWEMLKLNEIPRKEIEEWRKNLMYFKIPNGESNKLFYNRVKDFCDEFATLKHDLFIICHAGTINCIISYLANIPFEKLVNENWKKIHYGSITILERQKNKFNIKNFSE